MLRAIRNRLRAIRYYSASQHRTSWHRASDIALWAALVLAWPATWLASYAIHSSGLPLVVQGHFGEQPDGSLIAWMVEPGLEARGRIVGTFALSLVEHEQGWPFTTRVDPRPPSLDLDIFREPKPRTDVRLAPEDPLRPVIEAALREGAPRRMHQAWVQGDLPARSVWIGWVTGIMVWWVLLSAAGTGAVWLLAYAWRVHRGRGAARQADRLASGRCARCGYDLRGLEFNERCPECGSLT
ncbi:MAG: hypothetical protein ACYTJ0_09080 [Planctomycetota bacterium]|jgi:hypothetical protein